MRNELDQKFINKLAFLDSKRREEMILPEKIIENLGIRTQSKVLDFGAGSGFFTIPLAENTKVGILALDPDHRMIQLIKTKAEEKGLNNIEYLEQTLENSSVAKESLDFIIASLVLHEVSPLEETLTLLYQLLNNGGQLFILEYEKDDAIVEGPPMHIRLGSESIQKILMAIGYKIKKLDRINDAIYTVTAVK